MVTYTTHHSKARQNQNKQHITQYLITYLYMITIIFTLFVGYIVGIYVGRNWKELTNE